MLMATRVTWVTALPQDTLPDTPLDCSEHTKIIPFVFPVPCITGFQLGPDSPHPCWRL